MGVGAAIAAGSVASAGIGALASSSAAGQSASAAKQAADLQHQQYLQTRGDLAPFVETGQHVIPQLEYLAKAGPTGGGPNYLDMAAANLPGQMTQAQLEQTPGYQFNLAQGLKATQNAAAARGLGVSGAALKGAATYASGLADSTYQNQFANAQTRFSDYGVLNTAQQGNLQNQFSRLQNVASLGENAGAQTGTIGATLANQQGNALQAAGNAQAAGTLGISNALTGGINNYLGYQQLQQLIGPGAGSGGTGGFVDSGAMQTG